MFLSAEFPDASTPWYQYVSGSITETVFQELGAVVHPQLVRPVASIDQCLFGVAPGLTSLLNAKYQPNGNRLWAANSALGLSSVAKDGSAFCFSGNEFRKFNGSDGSQIWLSTAPNGYDACCSGDGKKLFSWNYSKPLFPGTGFQQYFAWNGNTGANTGSLIITNSLIGRAVSILADPGGSTIAHSSGRAAFLA